MQVAKMTSMDLRTERLAFREMTDEDLDAMAGLLGDPRVMTYYPRPKTRAEAQRWIDWNKTTYREHGFGLWILETHDGQFVGDCGLTMQEVEGQHEIEVGYHVRIESQNQGFATEAANATKAFAAAHGVSRLVAIIHPENAPSQRVAEKIGLTYEKTASAFDGDAKIYSASLA
jgi:RimJ/RimL family protein N-acetyltransferase